MTLRKLPDFSGRQLACTLFTSRLSEAGTEERLMLLVPAAVKGHMWLKSEGTVSHRPLRSSWTADADHPWAHLHNSTCPHSFHSLSLGTCRTM